MGWTETDHRPAGQSHQRFFARELLGDGQEILAAAHLGGIGGTFYAAVREKETGKVWALVVATGGRPGGRFRWKGTAESTGPAESDCPARVLDLLTPTTDELALAWRERCRERLRRLAAVVPGARLRFGFDYLTPEGPCRTFEVVDPGRDEFRGPRETVYRLRRWRREPFELVDGEARGGRGSAASESRNRNRGKEVR